MLVKGLKGADEDVSILQVAAHVVVNALQHLAALPHRHDCGSTKSDVHIKCQGH